MEVHQSLVFVLSYYAKEAIQVFQVLRDCKFNIISLQTACSA